MFFFADGPSCVMVRPAVLLLAVALCRAATLDSELGVGKAINIFMR